MTENEPSIAQPKTVTGAEQSKNEPRKDQTKQPWISADSVKNVAAVVGLGMVAVTMIVGVLNFCLNWKSLEISERNRAYEQELSVHEFWQRPNNHGGNETSELTEYLAGFELKIIKGQRMKFWHTQIISNRPIELDPGKYKMHFEIQTDKPFELYSRLGEDEISNAKNSFEAGPVVLDGNYQWKPISTTEFDFNNNAKNYLYFQIGLAPDNTTVKIRNIRFEKI